MSIGSITQGASSTSQFGSTDQTNASDESSAEFYSSLMMSVVKNMCQNMQNETAQFTKTCADSDDDS